MSRAISCSRATRFSTLGWVENRLSMRAPDSGLTMKRCAEAGLRSAGMLGMRCAAPAIFCKRRGERQRTAADLGALPVGLVFARAADRHLHQPGGERPEDQRAASVPMKPILLLSLLRPPNIEAEIGEHGDRAGDRRGDGHEQRVAVLDVAELMRQHAGELLLVHRAAAGRWSPRPRRAAGLRPVAKAFGCGFSMT